MIIPETLRDVLHELARTCRRHAVPMTTQRRVVLELLASRVDHPTADQVFEAVGEQLPEISRTTVYRILDTFGRIGVVCKVCHPDAAARYEIARERHHHLVCLSCGKMLDLYAPSLDNLPLPPAKSGFFIEDYSVQFRGRCSECAATETKIAKRGASTSSPKAKSKKSKERKRS